MARDVIGAPGARQPQPCSPVGKRRHGDGNFGSSENAVRLAMAIPEAYQTELSRRHIVCLQASV